MLHIAMNEHGLVLSYMSVCMHQREGGRHTCIVLGDDVIFASDTRGRGEVDGLEIPNL
jgi:hypothetical protein